jgi:hypothetical protein
MTRLISLLAAVTAMVLFVTPGFAQSPTYTWGINCSKNAAAAGVGTGVTWFWLYNGSVINSSPAVGGGGGGCSVGLQGDTDPIPETVVSDKDGMPKTVNGIQVNLSISTGCCGCDAYSTMSKSFSPSDPKFAITDSVSPPASVPNFFGPNYKCPNASASIKFSIHSN